MSSRLPDVRGFCPKLGSLVEYTGYGLSWIRTIAHRYNEGRPQADGATAAMAILARQRSCHMNYCSNYGRRCSLLLPIRACGQAEKWLPGSRTKPGVGCIPRRVGVRTSSAWVELCVCLVRVMPRPIPLSKKLLKTARCHRPSTTSGFRGDGRTVGFR